MEIIYIYKLSKVKWAILASSSSETIMNYWISHLFFIVIDIINIFAWKHPELHRHRSIYEPVLFTELFYRVLSAVEGKQKEREEGFTSDVLVSRHSSPVSPISTGPYCHEIQNKIKKKNQGANGAAGFTIFLMTNSWTANKSAVLQTEIILLLVTQSNVGFKLPPDQLWKS